MAQCSGRLYGKLLLIVEPKYAKAAMDIYQEMDKKKFFRAAILDTEKVMEEEHIVRQGALAEEVKAKEKYVQSYINFFLGNVMKCENIEELRECRIGVTPDCMLYHSYRLQHINPENYTRRAYIGEISLRQRIRQLQKHCDELQEKRLPLAALVEEAKKLLELEAVPLPTEDYISQILDAKAIKGKETRKKDILEKLQKLRAESVDTLEAQMKEVQESRDAKQKEITQTEKEIWKNGEEIEKSGSGYTYVIPEGEGDIVISAEFGLLYQVDFSYSLNGRIELYAAGSEEPLTTGTCVNGNVEITVKEIT